MPLTADSTKALNQVKKTGQPCRFVMMTKGVNVLSVVAYRKGSEDARIREAKQAGSGQICCGVVDGSSANLTFKLLRADGYDSPPVRTASLRDFLNNGTGLDLKATIEIVDSLPVVHLDGEEAPMQPQQTLQPQMQTQSQPQTQPQVTYISGDQWKQVLTTIQSANGSQRDELIKQAVRDLVAERDKNEQHLAKDPESPEGTEAQAAIAKVAEILKRLRTPQPTSQPTMSQPPSPSSGQQQGTASQSTTQPNPRPLPNRPQTPPDRPKQPLPPSAGRQKLKALQDERHTISADVQQRVTQVTELRNLYDNAQIDQILKDCETDANSDFGAVVSRLNLDLMRAGKKPQPRTAPDGSILDGVMSKLIAAKTGATEYIKAHKDPAIGSLPSRVKKRRQYCQQFIQQIDEYIKYIGDKNGAALDLCETYERRIAAGQYVPPEVAVELRGLLNQTLLPDDTKSRIRKTVEHLAQESQRLGYQQIANTPNLTEFEKIELMEAYGCGTKPTGGTSDVKLLKDAKGTIQYALKSAAKESEQALGSLGLPNGACAIREDISSTIFDKFRDMTQVDVGFPKSELMSVNGQLCAVIQGISGKMADKEGLEDIKREIEAVTELRTKLVDRQRPQEEIQPLDDALTALQQKLANARQDMESVPDQISATSMGKVLMSSILTGQWDLKWGNMIVEGQTARPIDAGAALPTLKLLDGFLSPNRQSLFGLPALEQLLMYPQGHSKQFQDLPIANQPLDPSLIKALLALDPAQLIQAAKDRRDELVQRHPQIGGGVPLLEDLSFEMVEDSIKGAQAIVRAKQPITLKEFVLAWNDWFKQWAVAFYASKNPAT